MSTDSSQKRARPGWAWLALLCATLSALAALGAGAGYRIGWWSPTEGFQILAAAAAMGAVSGLTSLGAALANWGLHRRATLIAVTGLAIGLFTAAIPAQWRLAQERLPAIHDITSDTENPPALVAAVRLRGPEHHSVTYAGSDLALKQKAAYPDIRPLHTRQDKARVFEVARLVIKDMDMRVVGESPAEGRLEAVATTALFGFKDDFVVRLGDYPTGTRVDARSMSRLGSSDLGQNAKRLRTFFNRLRTRLRD